MKGLFGYFAPKPTPTFWEGLLSRIPKVRKVVPESREIGWREVAVASGVAVSCYAVYRWGGVAMRRLMPGYQRLRTKLGFEPPIVLDGKLGTFQNIFESYRSGSEEEVMLVPKFQVMVGDMIAGEFHPRGCAIRMKDYLVMPSHVFAGLDDGVIVKGRQRWVRIERDRLYHELDTDLMAIRCTADELSTIGVGVPKISHMMPETGDYVQVAGVSGKGTVGVLREDPFVFGRVIYGGSTAAGYSGAGYVSGERLAGLHTNGGKVNGGYSASYILSLLNRLDREVPEGSVDWLTNMYKKGKKIRIDRRVEFDEVRISVGGRYAVVDPGSMQRAFGSDWQRQFADSEGSPGNRSYHDGTPESVSGELKSSKSGASSVVIQTPEGPENERLLLLKELEGLSTKRLKAIIQVLNTAKSSVTLESVVNQQPSKNGKV